MADYPIDPQVAEYMRLLGGDPSFAQEAPPQAAPTPPFRVGRFRIPNQILDAVTGAVADTPMPVNMRGGQGFAAGALRGFAGQRAEAAMARQADLEAKRKAYEDRQKQQQRLREWAGEQVVKARIDAAQKAANPQQPGTDDWIDVTPELLKWAAANRVAIFPGLKRVKRSDLTRDLPQQAPQLSLSPEALAFWSQNAAATGQLPTGVGRSQGVVKQLLEGTAREAKGRGASGYDMAAAKSAYKARTQSRAALQKTADAAEAFANTAHANSDVLRSTLQNIKDSGTPWINRPVRAVVGNLGDVDQARFRTALVTLQPEFARLLNSANMTGVLSDNARHEIQAVLSGNYTIPQLEGALEILEIDAENRKQSYRDQLDENLNQTARPISGQRDPNIDSRLNKLLGGKKP